MPEFTDNDSKKLEEIHRAIVGNKEYKQKGLIDRVSTLEECQKKHKLNFSVMYGVISICVLFLGFFEKIKMIFK